MPSQEMLSRLVNQRTALTTRRQELQRQAETILTTAREQRGPKATLSAAEDAEVTRHLGEIRTLAEDIDGLNEQITFETSEVERGRIPQLGSGRGGTRFGSERASAPNSAGALAPLHVPDEEVRRLQGAAQRGEPCRIETRAFSTADSLIPASLFPYPIEHIHENRLLEKLPGLSFDTPQITFIQHSSTTGAAAPTTEGTAKPELVLNTTALTLPAVKVAGHVGLSYETINDFEAFHQYAVIELQRQVVDQENQQLLTGSGVSPNMTGFFNTSGILTLDASTVTGTNVTAWDALNVAMNLLRNGPALAEGTLWVFNPNDWNAIRRIKDAYGRFLVSADPSTDQVNQAWGIPVFADIWCPAGKGLLIAGDKFGYVGVREPIVTRVGYSGTDLTQNILRFVAEERLTLCVTRPSAVVSITNLP